MNVLRDWSLRHARGLSRLYRWFERAAPVVGSAVRWVGEERLEFLVKGVERGVKQALFNCRMCGQCGLSVTGMACPMGCAKEMRNGPCGGVRPNGHCEVHPERRCTWVDATAGDERIQTGHTPTWTQRAAPRDHRGNGRSTWVPMLMPRPTKVAALSSSTSGGDKPKTPSAAGAPGLTLAAGQAQTSSRVLPTTPTATSSTALVDPDAFARRCRERDAFIVTVEISPPDSPDPSSLRRRAAQFEGLVDAINITDGAGANCHMSSVAAGAILTAAGHTVITQLTCRDRNRIALQGDVLGAAALGLRNVLCLTGDDVSQGDHPGAKPVFDLDSVNLLHTLRHMRDAGEFASGRRLEIAPKFFLGATSNPFVPPFKERVSNLKRKIDAGAEFVQTQFCFDIELLQEFMVEVRNLDLHHRAAIIVGVGALPSAKGLRWMAEHVPGVHVPQSVTDRVAENPDQRAAGINFCKEMIEKLRSVEGVAGVHLMGHKNESSLVQIIRESSIRNATASISRI